MIRIIAAIAAFLLSFADVCAQEYYVLQVKGAVRTRSGAVLKPEDQLRPEDKLVFSSAGDAVAVVSPRAGRFVIKPVPSAEGGEFIAIVKDAVTPGIKRLSTRSGSMNNVVDFQAFFQEPVVLLDTARIKISLAAFPLSQSSFFFIRYTYRGEEINKKLAFRGDTLLMTRAGLFAVDGVTIDPSEAGELRLFHLHDQKAHALSPVQLSLPDLESLIRELSALRASLGRNHDPEEEGFLYTTEFYGKTLQPDFLRWYRRYGGR